MSEPSSKLSSKSTLSTTNPQQTSEKSERKSLHRYSARRTNAVNLCHSQMEREFLKAGHNYKLKNNHITLYSQYLRSLSPPQTKEKETRWKKRPLTSSQRLIMGMIVVDDNNFSRNKSLRVQTINESGVEDASHWQSEISHRGYKRDKYGGFCR